MSIKKLKEVTVPFLESVFIVVALTMIPFGTVYGSFASFL